ncbi:MAG: hypothetical protein OXC98_09670 [bacterium]|nr:hypothetical protein [Acidimicrobiia bacterium]MCY4650619.1 hypothetical protein [bacterium]
MCAIIDAHVIKELLKGVGTAGSFFLSQVEDGKIKIAFGGQKLREEYWDSGNNVRMWLVGAINAGLVQIQDDDRVNRQAKQLVKDPRIRSDDWHILALAQISGARLLYSYDGDLRDDFKDKTLINKPSGKLYAGSKREALAKKHRHLLRLRLCRI